MSSDLFARRQADTVPSAARATRAQILATHVHGLLRDDSIELVVYHSTPWRSVTRWRRITPTGDLYEQIERRELLASEAVPEHVHPGAAR